MSEILVGEMKNTRLERHPYAVWNEGATTCPTCGARAKSLAAILMQPCREELLHPSDDDPTFIGYKMPLVARVGDTWLDPVAGIVVRTGRGDGCNDEWRTLDGQRHAVCGTTAYVFHPSCRMVEKVYLTPTLDLPGASGENYLEGLLDQMTGDIWEYIGSHGLVAVMPVARFTSADAHNDKTTRLVVRVVARPLPE